MSPRRILMVALVVGAMMAALAVPAFAAQGQITEVNPSGFTVKTPSGVFNKIAPKGWEIAQPSPPGLVPLSKSPGGSIPD